MRDLLPNHPLVESVFEVRFPAELRIEAARHEFYEHVKADFPDIHVPRVVSDEPQALLRYRFRRADGKREVQFSINTFSVHVSDYPGFAEIRPTVLRLIRQFAALFKITNFKRLGLRYINMIPAVRQGTTNEIPVKEHLRWNPGFTMPIAEWPVMGMQSATTLAVAGGHVRVELEFQEDLRAETWKSQFRLDLDSVRESSFPLSELERHLDERHQILDDCFFSIVSESYISALRESRA